MGISLGMRLGKEPGTEAQPGNEGMKLEREHGNGTGKGT